MIRKEARKYRIKLLVVLSLMGTTHVKAQIGDLPEIPYVPHEDTVELTATSQKNSVITFESHDGTLQSGIKTVKYYDSFGRLEETVAAGISPAQKDLVTVTEYDNAGRHYRTWLPGMSDNNDGSYVGYSQAVLLSSADNSDTAPYSITAYEPSPLNRVAHQYGPGAAWHNNMKSVSTDYVVNVQDGDRLNVLSLRATDGVGAAVTIVADCNLPTGTLQGTKTTDEEGNERYEFHDLWGNLILSRAIVDGEEYDTYYVYDDMGNLRAVLPPAILDEDSSLGTIDTDLISQYAYLYRYDERFRMVGKKLPGTEWQYMYYDNADRLVFSQDGNQRTRNEYSFYIYDAVGRECIRGTFTSSNAIGNLNDYVKCTYTGTESQWKGYVVSGISVNSPAVEKVSYYDNYDFISSSATTWPVAILPQFTGGNLIPCTQGLLTGCSTAIVPEGTGSSCLYKAFYYDDRGRIIHTDETTCLGGKDTEDLELSFTGQPLVRTHVQTNGAQVPVTEVCTYTYDHADRLKSLKHKLNDNDEVTVALYNYDNLGRLALKTLGNGEAIDYSYNVRSWMRQLTSSKFHELLEYNYNGNVSSQAWLSNGSCPDGYYDFTYDNLSRLTSAQWGNNYSDYDYSVDYTYDKMGNILSLQRNGMQQTAQGTSYACTVDDLTMNYNGNQLIQVSDDHYSQDDKRIYDFWDGANETVEFSYDGNGNMTQDLNKGISLIRYNQQNLPMCIKFPNDSIKYSYSVDGQKLKTTCYRTVYLAGPANPFGPFPQAVHGDRVRVITFTTYCKNFTYADLGLSRIDFDGGYISLNALTGSLSYHYYLQDHLGSNRMVLSSTGAIEQEQHYYPFGGIMGESVEGNAQRYRYNGKEFESMGGLNMHDYGARLYDQTLGRWNGMDKLAEKYYDVSPYAYCLNNPMRMIDKDGLRPGDFFKTIDEAAIDFGLFYNDNSIRENREYGTYILRVYNANHEVGYTYGIPNVGNHESVTIDNPPAIYRAVARIHTHGNANPQYYNNEFSGIRYDKGSKILASKYLKIRNANDDIGNANTSRMNSYLVTPNGALQKYEYRSAKISVISKDMPSDENDHTRLNSVSSKSENHPFSSEDVFETLKKFLYNNF